MLVTDPEGASGEGGASRRWTAAALLVLGLALAQHFHEFWGHDPREVVLTSVPEVDERRARGTGWAAIGAADHRFVVWLVARNAYTLLTRPSRLFDAEQCYPARKALAFGEPGITLGILGMPAYVLSGDPVATFNFVLLVVTIISALSMYWLVREWTGVPAAGIVASLLYGFHELRTANVVTFFIIDNAWTVFALFFARRLFAHGRWPDAAGLALSVCLQIGGSFYPLVPAFVLAIPFVAWLVIRYGIRKIGVAQCLVIAAMVGLAGFLVFRPYLELTSSGGLGARGMQIFLPLAWLLPGERAFPGWVVLALAVAGLALGRRRAVAGISGDPRWVLLIGALLVLNLATGGNKGDRWAALASGEPVPAALPSLYGVLAPVIPGLDVVRGPGSMYSGTLLALCVLAGLGAGAVLRVVPRHYATVTASVLILLAYADTFLPRVLTQESRASYAVVPMRPAVEQIEFFEKLESLGNSGPILELPNETGGATRASASLLLSAYHHRPTSQCYNSFRPQVLQEVRELGARLPQAGAVRALREMGFTTVVVRHPWGPRHARARFASLEKLYGNNSMTAYAIDDKGGTGDDERP
jgi:hypothetical protein